VLIASERAVKQDKLTPRARIHTLSVVGSDPVVMLDGPIPRHARHRHAQACGSATSTCTRSTKPSRPCPLPGPRRSVPIGPS
jgi:hypothetical protein